MTDCRNCGAELKGRFCHDCGQKDSDLARPFVHLARDALFEAFDIDGRAWRTLRTLFQRPGLLTREFLAGRRMHYTPPLRLYVFISVAFFLAMAWAASAGLLLDPQQTLNIDAESQAQFVSGRLPRIMFILMPVFALLLKLAHWRSLYFEHLIFSLHLHSAAYLILILALPFEQLADSSVAALLAQVAVLSWFLLYLYFAMRRVYEAGRVATSIRASAILLTYFLIVSIAVEAAGAFLILGD